MRTTRHIIPSKSLYTFSLTFLPSSERVVRTKLNAFTQKRTTTVSVREKESVESMCNKNSEEDEEDLTIMKMVMMQKKKKKKQISKEFTNSSSSSSSSLKPNRRRNRTKTRKPKYLSLRLQLSQAQPESPAQQKPETDLNLLPEVMHEEHNDVALLFGASDGGATLTGLLEDESTTTAATSEDRSPSAMTCSPAMDLGLVRKAMRKGRRKESEEERWVCYSEVVEEIKKEVMTEEVTSCSDPFLRTAAATATATSFGSLSLKLDHEGILNAWSDKGPLYVDEAPQTVPDLSFNGGGGFLHNALPPNVPWDGWGSDVVGNTWKVPEDCGGNKTKVGQREASVQRYKEKRQNRLFAKKIRYEVRKLNAEKRPRMKGRFVKRE